MGVGALGEGLGAPSCVRGYVVVVISVFGGFGSLSGHQSISANRKCGSMRSTFLRGFQYWCYCLMSWNKLFRY